MTLSIKELLEEPQEDRYHRIKEAIEEATGKEMSSDTMNKLFFEILEPPSTIMKHLHSRLEKISAAVKVVIEQSTVEYT